MSKNNAIDDAAIIRCYNDNGSKQAYAFIRDNYGSKRPSYVLKRLKASSEYGYDDTTDKFMSCSEKNLDEVFLGMDELCNSKVHKIQKDIPSLEVMVQHLIEDRLRYLCQYVHMNQTDKEILIDRTSLLADGYTVSIH